MTAASSTAAPAPLPIVILISGRGSNMRAIAELAARGELPVTVRAVISDRADAAGLGTAASLQIPVATLSPRDFPDRPAYDTALAALVSRYQPELIVLAGFMRILTANFITPFAGRMMNIHPSLLPKYRGLHTHRRALESGDSMHGASVHCVTEELDSGPIIIQARLAVQPDDTENTLSARVQQLEHSIYPRAVDWFARGRLRMSGQQAWLDGAELKTPVVVDHSEVHRLS
jgi:phosphoribosylglycinamide formyltransferase-1